MTVPVTAAVPRVVRLLDTVQLYVALTKPRIIELLLLTTLPVMFLASDGVPRLGLVLFTLVGGTLSAGSANALNCVVDADIDARMRRTRRRPLARDAVTREAALVFGLTLGVVSTLLLGVFVNWWSALLAVAANAFYVLGYTMWLKPRTSQNIVWGGAAGCVPTLIGWTAVRDDLAWAPVVLFLVVFFWTPPHFWALAIRYREDYAAAEVPMLPAVAPVQLVARQIVAYAVATVATSLVLWPVAHTGPVFPVLALVLGAVFVGEAVGLRRRAAGSDELSELRPMRLFHLSNAYLTLLFLAVALVPFVR
ncbi:MAG: heme o synthase [Nocardioides sp.]